MRIGRTGTFTTKSGKVGVAAVVAITGSDTLVAKEPNTGALIRFSRGEFQCFNSCGMNPHAAEVVRKATGVTEAYSGYGSGYGRVNEFNSEPEGTIASEDFEFGATGVSELTAAALEQAVKQMRNKKRVTAIPATLAALLRPLFRGQARGKASTKRASVRK